MRIPLAVGPTCVQFSELCDLECSHCARACFTLYSMACLTSVSAPGCTLHV